MSNLFLAYASLKGLDASDLRFTLRVELILPEATPESLSLASKVEHCYDWLAKVWYISNTFT